MRPEETEKRRENRARIVSLGKMFCGKRVVRLHLPKNENDERIVKDWENRQG
jgi:hypothetical protein